MVAKTYSKNIFGGKDAVWNGIDQGKHPLYPSALNMSLNAIYDNNVFKSRDGQSRTSFDAAAGVLSGVNTINCVVIAAGTELFAEEIE